MISSIINVVRNAAAFLSSNKVPPGTPYNLRNELRRTNHFSSKKFFIAWTSFVGVLLFYCASVVVLFFIPQDQGIVSGYITIFTKTIEVVAIIIAAYLGVQAAIDFKYGSSSNVSNDTSTNIEDVEQRIIQEQTVKYAEKFKEDPSYAPLEWVFKEDNE